MLPVIRTRSFLPQWIEEFFGNDFLSDEFFTRTSIPSVNVTEKPDKYTIEVAAPGLKKEDFKIELNNGILKICSEKKQEEEKKDEKILRREFSYCSFTRTFSVPETVVEDKIEARYENGILVIDLPKREEAKPKALREIVIK